MRNEYPLVVRMIKPKLAIAGAIRSSSMQSSKFGRNIHRGFMLGVQLGTQQVLFQSLSTFGLTGQSIESFSIIAGLVHIGKYQLAPLSGESVGLSQT
jgi:hypothetical protein